MARFLESLFLIVVGTTLFVIFIGAAALAWAGSFEIADLQRHVRELSEQVQVQARQIQSLQAQIGERR